MTAVMARGQARSGLELCRVTPEDRPAVAAMAGRCSRATVYRRFHGFIDLPTYVAGLFAGEQYHLAAWCGGACVGLATVASSWSGHDVGVLVEDRWQRRGIGSALCEELVTAARQMGLAGLHADVLSDDAFVLRLLRRHGSLDINLEYGVYSVDLSFDEPAP
jgi:GNAT superfamily N-acetyltransferase